MAIARNVYRLVTIERIRSVFVLFFEILCVLILIAFSGVNASEFDTTVPMRDKGASTFYAPCIIEGYGDVEMLVDTGSAYTTINEETLAVLKKRGMAYYVKDLEAKMADGSQRVVPVYRLSSIHVGGDCEIEDVEAAVLPGNTRSLLGLSALSKAGPIIFSADPPRLTLSNCVEYKK